MSKKQKFHHKFHVEIKTAVLTVAAFAFAFLLYATDHGSFLYRTSIVNIPQHKAFDGTTYPVAKVPNWVKLSSEKYTYSYDSLGSGDLINIPEYRASELSRSTDNLTWGNNADDKIRNAKITYSVPYMGNYKLDGREYAGSHLAVDIKIPKGTPIFSIANGTVIKASNQSSGFGKHIVIQHNNFPKLSGSGKSTLYSSYSHLDLVLVNEGQVVDKGDKIGLSGNTGTATTPHLHFQIDNDEAPWHPYWPFTWQQASEAGLDFFSAINAGLGRDDALKTTVNPMLYVQKFLNGSSRQVDEEDEKEDVDEERVVNKENKKDDFDDNIGSYVPNEKERVNEPISLPSANFTVEFQVNSRYLEDSKGGFKVILKDSAGNAFSGNFTENISLDSEKGKVTVKNLRARNFEHGVYDGSFRKMKVGRDRLVAEIKGRVYYSNWFEVVEEGSAIGRFSDLSSNNPFYESIMYLSERGVVSGYLDGTFKASRTVSRAEVLKFVLAGLEIPVEKGEATFRDTARSDWYNDFLYTAHRHGIVNGDPDGKYRPNDTINKAEFYKILFETAGVDINPIVSEDPFVDVSKDAWFAPYIAYAKQIGLIDSNILNFSPEIGMRRGEVADAMYRMMKKM